MSPDPESPSTPRDHYSYTVYADPAMAESFDRARFSGPIGVWLAETQAAILREYASARNGDDVLDVGTGTGRAALILAESGARVTAVDASAEMLRVAEARAVARGAAITFGVGDAHHLAFPDRAFDTVVSLRVLMHTPNWRQCVAEACRVSRGRVIVDYPAALSVAAVQSATRKLVHQFGVSTEPYRVFSAREIHAAFASQGFRITREHRQFVLPIAFHKLIGSRGFSQGLEQGLAAVGLLGLTGSPVTVLAER